jgi:large subunit ribosomal protein L3
MIPATIIQLDRAQVVQIKEPEEGNSFFQVQMGTGERRIKSLIKAEIGHFMKANVPPKK